ncbi:MAG: hypothetical protein J6X89_04960 [Bacteroidales bacterium]|nr:hypothetical protein [Bacteroidales bacterium]
MNRCYLVAALLLFVMSSCGVSRHSTKITDVDEQVAILKVHYPQLYEYYTDGYLGISSIEAQPKEDGSTHYDVNYFFKRKYVKDYSQQMELLKTNFPEIYNLYTQGKIVLNEMYEYINEDDGIVHVNIGYKLH